MPRKRVFLCGGSVPLPQGHSAFLGDSRQRQEGLGLGAYSDKFKWDCLRVLEIRAGQGANLRTVAKELGVPVSTLQGWRQVMAPDLYVPSGRKVRIPPEIRQKVLDMIEQGVPVQRAARRWGVSSSTARNWVKDREGFAFRLLYIRDLEELPGSVDSTDCPQCQSPHLEFVTSRQGVAYERCGCGYSKRLSPLSRV